MTTAKSTPKNSVLRVTRTERLELPNNAIAQWAACMIEERGDYYTDHGLSLHDAGSFIGETVTAEVE